MTIARETSAYDADEIASLKHLYINALTRFIDMSCVNNELSLALNKYCHDRLVSDSRVLLTAN